MRVRVFDWGLGLRVLRVPRGEVGRPSFIQGFTYSASFWKIETLVIQPKETAVSPKSYTLNPTLPYTLNHKPQNHDAKPSSKTRLRRLEL